MKTSVSVTGRRSAVAVVFFGVLWSSGALAGCSSHDSAGVAANKIATTVCNKIQECSPVLLQVAWGDVNTCISKTTEGTLKGRDKDAQEACTTEELNKCLADTKAIPCDKYNEGLAATPIKIFADSCNGC